jgi:membrane-bound ClpP family serine protease
VTKSLLLKSGLIARFSEIIEEIHQHLEDAGVKAIVLRIDSPGGGVGPAQEIHREVQKARGKKKVITSMGSVAASGGYYIACASDLIVANPGTITVPLASSWNLPTSKNPEEIGSKESSSKLANTKT